MEAASRLWSMRSHAASPAGTDHPFNSGHFSGSRTMSSSIASDRTVIGLVCRQCRRHRSVSKAASYSAQPHVQCSTGVVVDDTVVARVAAHRDRPHAIDLVPEVLPSGPDEELILRPGPEALRRPPACSGTD
jgi:hypothetical protein